MSDDRFNSLDRMQARSLVIGAAGCAFLLIGCLFDREHFFRAYLTAYLWCLGIALGAMALVMLHHLVGGAWGILIRRIAEAAAMTLPALAALFVPIAIGFYWLYPWARADEVAHDPMLQHRHVLFNTPLVLVRAVIYFAVWIFWAARLRSLSLEYDQTPDQRIGIRLQRLSALGLVVYFITMSLASVDWIASREVDWYSSVFGLLVIVGQAAAGLTFVLVLLWHLSKSPPLRDVVTPDRLQDLGNLLLTVVVLWAYISFAQFLVIWMGNSQEDNLWYIHRDTGIWLLAGIALMVLHFAVPFFLLLIQQAKRRLNVLASIAAVVLAQRYVDVLWMVARSSPSPEPAGLSWMDLVAPLGVGGIWFGVFLWNVKRHPLLPLGEQEQIPLTQKSHGTSAKPIL